MGLFEWLGEIFKPGPIGHIYINPQPLLPGGVKRIWIVLFSILGLGIFALLTWLALSADDGVISFTAITSYLLVSYLFTPKADMTNMGWLGGLINNPFRVSDNYNRFLFFLSAVLIPGKLVVFAVQSIYKLVKYN
jgi:hypothetical protein